MHKLFRKAFQWNITKPLKKNSCESVLMRWMKLEPIIQSEVSQKHKDQYSILMHIYGILKDGNDNPVCKTVKETQMYRTDFGRREGGLRWGTHVNPWLIHVNVWPKQLQCCRVISLQLIKINGKKKGKPFTSQLWFSISEQQNPKLTPTSSSC